MDKKLEQALKEHGVSEKELDILKLVKPNEDGDIFTIGGQYHFYARIRKDNMVHIPEELIKEMRVEEDDLVTITIQSA